MMMLLVPSTSMLMVFDVRLLCSMRLREEVFETKTPAPPLELHVLPTMRLLLPARIPCPVFSLDVHPVTSVANVMWNPSPEFRRATHCEMTPGPFDRKPAVELFRAVQFRTTEPFCVSNPSAPFVSAVQLSTVA
jgi:hypothetical protein